LEVTLLSVERHGRKLLFDDDGFASTPYVYCPILKKDELYEEPFLKYIRSLDLQGVYVDIGAHLGTHTVWFATVCPSTRVHAFEPLSRLADVVRRNVTLNELDGKVTLHQVGLSDRPGRATNTLSPEHQWGFHEKPDRVTRPSTWRSSIVCCAAVSRRGDEARRGGHGTQRPTGREPPAAALAASGVQGGAHRRGE
jgi:FkbM family methyltransferase